MSVFILSKKFLYLIVKLEPGVYLADRRIDILPTKLCSLREKQDRLTFSCIWEFEASGKIVKTWYGRTIIQS